MDADIAFVPQLCLVRPEVTTAPQLLTLMASTAIRHGYAHASFEDALLARERQFPTGLPTPTPVAIPHTDCVHVRRPALAAAILDPPLPFGEMGAATRNVLARLVIVLLVTDPSDQVGVLSNLISALQHGGWADALGDIADPTCLAQTLQQVLTRHAT